MKIYKQAVMETDNTYTQYENLLLLSDFPIRGRHSRFSIASGSYLLYPSPSLQPQSSVMSSFTTYINLLFGPTRFLFPGNSILSILLPMYPSSFLRTCPYDLSLASRVFSPTRPTCHTHNMNNAEVLYEGPRARLV